YTSCCSFPYTTLFRSVVAAARRRSRDVSAAGGRVFHRQRRRYAVPELGGVGDRRREFEGLREALAEDQRGIVIEERSDITERQADRKSTRLNSSHQII